MRNICDMYRFVSMVVYFMSTVICPVRSLFVVDMCGVLAASWSQQVVEMF